MTAQNLKEEKLLIKIRKMSDDEFDSLLSFIDKVVDRQEKEKLQAKLRFVEIMKEISAKAEERGLTEHILNRILLEENP